MSNYPVYFNEIDTLNITLEEKQFWKDKVVRNSGMYYYVITAYPLEIQKLLSHGEWETWRIMIHKALCDYDPSRCLQRLFRENQQIHLAFYNLFEHYKIYNNSDSGRCPRCNIQLHMHPDGQLYTHLWWTEKPHRGEYKCGPTMSPIPQFEKWSTEFAGFIVNRK